MKKSFRDEVLGAVQQTTGWSAEEARRFLLCIRGDTPEALVAACCDSVAWASRVETQAAMINLMKTLPEGFLDAEWKDGELGLRISPDANVEELPDGTINILRGARQ